MINHLGKYKNKYRIASSRASWWDYGQDAAYFITVCTQHRIHHFGKISEGKAHLSEIGAIVEKEWLKTVDLRSDMNLTLGEFVIMPNHFHAIIIIGKNKYNDKNIFGGEVGDGNGNISINGDMGVVETQCIASLQSRFDSQSSYQQSRFDPRLSGQQRSQLSYRPPPLPCKNKFAPQSKNLPSIIRGFKTGVTVNARQIHTDFEWQPRYHDRIIRDHQEYQHIENYIIHNPLNWESDRFFSL